MNPAADVPITLETRIPPSFDVFIDYLMKGPSMATVHPLANKVWMQVHTYLPPAHNPPDMMTTLQLSFETEGPMTALREAYMGIFPSVPLNVYDRYPLFPMFNMPIKIMAWNVQGVGNKMSLIRELKRIDDHTVLALVETHISREQAQTLCDRIGFSSQLRVEAHGFSGGIWLF